MIVEASPTPSRYRSACVPASTRGLQGDVVYLSWPKAHLVYEPKCGGGGVARSQPMRTAVHSTWHGAQINFGDLTPYLTYGRTIEPSRVRPPVVWLLAAGRETRTLKPLPPGFLVHILDQISGWRFLVGTGAAFSILPYSSTLFVSGQEIVETTGSPIKWWGDFQVKLKLLNWTCLQAEVQRSLKNTKRAT